MTTGQIKRGTFALFIFSFLLAACKKDAKICNIREDLTYYSPTIYQGTFSGAQELFDTLMKYPQLQFYRISNSPENCWVKCYLSYKGLQIFTDRYSIFKTKSDSFISVQGTPVVDNINISLTPSILSDEAISIATKTENYSNTCFSYRLGIYNSNAGTLLQQKDYKLSWKIRGELGHPTVILDANNGHIYSRQDDSTD